jgi:signal transduction histidine kinase/CheY-like chemotaxis protein
MKKMTELTVLASDKDTTLATLSQELLRSVLDESKNSKGLLACRVSLHEDRFTIVSIFDSTPLAFPNYRMSSVLSLSSLNTSIDVSHQDYHSLVTFPLAFQGKQCGMLMMSNQTHYDLSLLDPLIIHTGYLIGVHLSLTQVTIAHDFFLSSVSHELRTPLSGVIGMTRLLQASSSTLTDTQKEFLDIINQCGFQLLEIINDILDYSKMDTGKLKLECAPFNVAEAVSLSTEVVFIKAHEKKLRLTTTIDPLVPSVLIGDRKRFRQILINLLTNAIKFTEEGTVSCDVRYQDETVIVQVQDTGIGIPESEFQNIFRSFFQIKSGSNPLQSGEGMGLGLAICKKLIDLMNGDIHVKHSKPMNSSIPSSSTFSPRRTLSSPQSQLTHGTCMEFKIPMQESTLLDDKGWVTLNDLLKDKVLLVIDADLNRKQTLAEFFDHFAGVFVMLSSSVQEAALYLKSKSPDVLLIESKQWNKCAQETPQKFLSRLQGIPTLFLDNGVTSSGSISPRPYFIIQKLSEATLFQGLSTLLPKTTTVPSSSPLTSLIPQRSSYLSMTILVVEDNETNIRVATEYLYQLGYKKSQITVAKNGKQSLDLCKTAASFDVILMDLKMPGTMDGYQATRHILDHYSQSRRTPPLIVAMTAFVSSEERSRCLQLGMKGFLSKPLILGELQTTLDRLYQKKQLSAK